MPFLCLASSVTSAKSNKKISLYDDTYVMQTYTNNINQAVYDEAYGSDMDNLINTEIKYQFSIALPISRFKHGSIMVSYTQLSLWQLANSDASAPFRETNYNPQIFMMHQGNYWLFNNIEYGYRHQSNGKDEGTSRAWDMGYLAIERIGNRHNFGVQGWYAKVSDDNEDIEDFIPPYEVWVEYNGDSGSLKMKTAYNFKTDKGRMEVGYSYPLSKFIDLYAQVFTGYGESLIDYNHKQTRIGLGVAINQDLNVF